MNNKNILNSSLEFGLRVVVLLAEFENTALSLDQILEYDYLMTNSGEFDERYPSLHPETPYRYSRLLVKREAFKEGIEQMCKNGLINIEFTSEGICYQKNKFTGIFLNNLNSNYKCKLVQRANWIANEIHTDESKTVIKELKNRISRYGIEFYREG